jgi:hypothetical protein
MDDHQWIGAAFDQLLDTADVNAFGYFQEARKRIDNEFGEGYGKKNPTLVAAYMQVIASEHSGAMHKLAAQDIRKGLNAVAEAIRQRE